jgi:hypothetical protein
MEANTLVMKYGGLTVSVRFENVQDCDNFIEQAKKIRESMERAPGPNQHKLVIHEHSETPHTDKEEKE